MNVTSVTVVASIDPKLLENLIDMEKIGADSVDDCTDEIILLLPESTQERGACYGLLRMRPLSISWAACSAEKSIMTNLASEAMDARCGDCV
jgi:hypothetical protein